MAIILTVAPLIRSFRGYEDPALPAGYWFVRSAILGDASGSLMSLDIRFSTTNEPANSLMYSLEQYNVNVSRVVFLDARLDIGNFDPAPSQASTGSVTHFYAFFLTTDPAVSGRAALNLRDHSFLPLFLGSPNKFFGTELGTDMENVLGTSMAVNAQGYFWTPGARNAPGGPQRPPNGLYGR